MGQVCPSGTPRQPLGATSASGPGVPGRDRSAGTPPPQRPAQHLLYKHLLPCPAAARRSSRNPVLRSPPAPRQAASAWDTASPSRLAHILTAHPCNSNLTEIPSSRDIRLRRPSPSALTHSPCAKSRRKCLGARWSPRTCCRIRRGPRIHRRPQPGLRPITTSKCSSPCEDSSVGTDLCRHLLLLWLNLSAR